MHSPYAASIRRRDWKPSKKLVPNLYDKVKYVTHYRNLKFYLQQGLVLTKIHRVLSFTQQPWLRPWIDLCMEQRRNARSEFEADLAKLQAKSYIVECDLAYPACPVSYTHLTLPTILRV